VCVELFKDRSNERVEASSSVTLLEFDDVYSARLQLEFELAMEFTRRLNSLVCMASSKQIELTTF
jgi:hypothetical protein